MELVKNTIAIIVGAGMLLAYGYVAFTNLDFIMAFILMWLIGIFIFATVR